MQKTRAERDAKRVTNDITLKPRVAASDVKRTIEDALKQSAELDASRSRIKSRSVLKIAGQLSFMRQQ